MTVPAPRYFQGSQCLNAEPGMYTVLRSLRRYFVSSLWPQLLIVEGGGHHSTILPDKLSLPVSKDCSG